MSKNKSLNARGSSSPNTPGIISSRIAGSM